jgi:hypothetical protein
MNDNIKALHDTWKKAENAIPRHEYDKGYKYRTKLAQKAWREFNDACAKEGLHTIQVAMQYVDKIIKVN